MKRMRKTTTTTTATCSQDELDEICNKLVAGKSVDVQLPEYGRLHIERFLPFICVYRRPEDDADVGTDSLITGEASYLLISDAPSQRRAQNRILYTLASRISGHFNAVLIIEIWSGGRSSDETTSETASKGPGFKISTLKKKPPTRTVEALERSLRALKLNKRAAKVAIAYGDACAPDGMAPLLTPQQTETLNCFQIGIEVDPIYQDPQSGAVFPILLRMLHRALSRSVRRAFFDFSRSHTTYRSANYLSFGTRKLVAAVRNVDRKLAEIANSFDLLVFVTPINVESAWADFQGAKFERTPTFYYRPRPIDPSFVKRKLYEIVLERVEDPTLAHLFRIKRRELDRQLTMLEERGTYKFFCGSLQLYGPLKSDFVAIARDAATRLARDAGSGGEQATIDAEAFAAQAREEIDYYRGKCPDFSGRVDVRDDTVGLIVSGDVLLVGREFRVPALRAEALIHHEIGTHILTRYNGQAQPFQQLQIGLPGYEELQEGLAVLAEYLVGGLSSGRLRLLAGRVLAARSLIDGATFIETFRLLSDTYDFEKRSAFTITARIYRGGGFIKDAIYLRGLVYVLDYLRNGGDIAPLFVGKIAAENLSFIKELTYREIFRPIPLQPRYMERRDVHERLQRLKGGLSLLDLVAE